MARARHRGFSRRPVRHRHEDRRAELPGDSGRAQTIQNDAFPDSTTGAGEIVLIQSKTLKADDPEYRAVVRDLEKRMDALPEANKLDVPLRRERGKGLISPDEHTVQVSFEVPGTATQTDKRVDATLAVTKAMQKAHPDFHIAQFGGASSDKELMETFENDLAKAETLSLPITLIILLARVRRPRGRRPAAPARPHRCGRARWASSASSAS